MKLTERLMEEHNEIRSVLVVVEKIAEELKKSNTFYPDDVETVSNYILTYWDLKHCKKEEHLFYPALIQEGLVTEKANIEMVLQEHVFGRNYLKEIESCIENCKLGNPFSIDKLAELLTNYVSMINKHMSKEESYYFVLADKVINNEIQTRMLKDFQLIDDSLRKDKKFGQYAEKYRLLESKYID